MALKSYINNKKSEVTIGGPDMSDRERHLLQALMSLLYYINGVPDSESEMTPKGLLFQRGMTPIGPKIQIGG